MPRSAKLTSEMQTQFCAMVSVGCTRRTAAYLVGVAESTVRNTIRRDAAFAERVKGAERQREIIPLRNLQNAGVKYWRAAAWFLERLNPQVYGRRKPREITPEELAEVMERFAKIVVRHIATNDARQAAVNELKQLHDELLRDQQAA